MAKHFQTKEVALVAVLIVGMVAFGHSILAQENIMGEVLVEASVVGLGKYFVLYIQGDSMTYVGINDSDLIIVRYKPIA